MKYQDLIYGMKHFGAKDEDVCRNSLGIGSDRIHENVVISPGWGPDKITGLGNAELIVPSGPLFGYQVWDVEGGGLSITYIKAGFGAPVILDALLPLGMTNCKRILFVSSVGGLSEEIGVGDLVIPEYSACGDGASRYIASDDFQTDVFGEKAYPDAGLAGLLRAEAQTVCGAEKVGLHGGRTFCTDTIFAQFPHIGHIIQMGYNTVDMETAAAFRAASLMGIPLAALFNVSDNTVKHNSVLSGTTQAEKDYRTFVRCEVMPQIIHRVFRAHSEAGR